MGRPYAAELDELSRTYSWALDASVESLADTVALHASSPLIAVGSGGSLTAAHFASYLHALLTGQIAQVLTPYELMSSAQSFESLTVLILSAGGSNPDVLACAEEAARRLPLVLTGITTKPDSPLGRILNELSWPGLHEFQTPTRKDGFLATNSLLATLVLLARAYSEATGSSQPLPGTLDDLVHPGKTTEAFLKKLSADMEPVLDRQTLVVLHGSTTKSAAADIESRFTEAALGSVQIADFRNFAHGRHHWLAANPTTTAILSLCAPLDRQIAKRTLALIPKQIPRASFDVESSAAGIISSVCMSIYLAQIAGKVKGIDPGRPHVPMFGRKLYHLRAPLAIESEVRISNRTKSAIESKAGLSCRTLAERGELDSWIDQYRDFVQKLGGAALEAIVFDYDGTLCGPNRRFDGPAPDIMTLVNALLKAGLYIGIATGRGKSVRTDLQKTIRSRALRKRVLIAYHNGSEIGTLDDSNTPPENSTIAHSLKNLVDPLRETPGLIGSSRITAKGSQISIEFSRRAQANSIIESVNRTVRETAPAGVTVVSSTHSIDVLAPGVSKVQLLKHLQTLTNCPDDNRILCIGDRGRWPGNDAALLSHPLSLSVDMVSRDPRTCWNLSDPGHRFDIACGDYLNRIEPRKSGARFDIKGLVP